MFEVSLQGVQAVHPYKGFRQYIPTRGSGSTSLQGVQTVHPYKGFRQYIPTRGSDSTSLQGVHAVQHTRAGCALASPTAEPSKHQIAMMAYAKCHPAWAAI